MKQKLAGILLLAAVILAAGGYAVYSVKSEATVLDGYLGGEKIGLFEDAQVQKILKKKYKPAGCEWRVRSAGNVKALRGGRN